MTDGPQRTPPPTESFETEDERWSTRNQIKDWLIILGILASQYAWMWAVFAAEPGIR